MSWHDERFGFRPYVSVVQRRAQAAKEVAKRLKKGQATSPITITGHKITTTFWGDAWCANLEGYSDFRNRLPRGRTYVRNGSVIDLKIENGRIFATVSGSELYDIRIDITPLAKPRWLALKKLCAGRIGSLVDLLRGKLSTGVMELVTDRTQGLFPKPNEIAMRCSCPDYAGMCKHLAAVLYGVGHRLDTAPELLFVLRGVDHQELIDQPIPTTPLQGKRVAPTIATKELGAIFDIDIDDEPSSTSMSPDRKKATPKPVAKVKPLTKKPKAAKKPKAPPIRKKG